MSINMIGHKYEPVRNFSGSIRFGACTNRKLSSHASRTYGDRATRHRPLNKLATLLQYCPVIISVMEAPCHLKPSLENCGIFMLKCFIKVKINTILIMLYWNIELFEP